MNRTAQPEELLGCEPATDSPFGELIEDGNGRPVAVICHRWSKGRPLPNISGLKMTREKGPGPTEKITYTRELVVCIKQNVTYPVGLSLA